jgi:Fe-S-cluster-containing dehydrogenase component
MKRRSFLQLAGAASASLLPTALAANEETLSTDFDEAHGVLVDTTVCIGCRKCEYACDRENELTGKELQAFEGKIVLGDRRPVHDAFTVVNQVPDPGALEGRSYVKVQCMHCNRPACVSACIVGALRKEPSGPVIYDAWKCIGCRYCMVACPFQIPAYEYADVLAPRVRKCDFCSKRLAEGKETACIAICPNEALTFGARADLIALAHSKIASHPERYVDHVYGETEAGGTSWMYLARVDFAEAGLPRLESDPIPERTEKIQHGIFKSFLPPVMLYGLLGLIMYTTGRDEKDEGESSE